MKTYALTLAVVLAVISWAAPAPIIPGTLLTYQGPGTVTVADPATVVDLLTNAPYGGLNPVPPGIVAIIVSNASGGASKIKPVCKSSGDIIAVFFYGDASMLQVDCGQSDCHGKLYYLYAQGTIGKVLLKGMGLVGKVVVNNDGASTGVQIQNISKDKGATDIPGVSVNGGIHSVITAGLLDRLHSNHGTFGGTSATDPGVIAVGADSIKGQVKAKGGLAHLLICKELTSSNKYDYAAAYTECMATKTVQPYVVSAQLKRLNTKKIGPAVCAVKLEKKCSAKKMDVTPDLIVREPVVE